MLKILKGAAKNKESELPVPPPDLQLGDADDAAAESPSGVPGRLAELVAALPEVVLVGVDDHGAAEDGVGPGKGQEGVAHVNLKVINYLRRSTQVYGS